MGTKDAAVQMVYVEVVVSSSQIESSSVDVSIIIPSFNEGDWLRRTVESILSVKSNLNFEIVVVDDGCTDGSVEAIAGMSRIKVIRTGATKLGLILGKNMGAKVARGSYFCFLDSHVLVHDYWIDYLRETCNTFPQGALVSGNLPDVALLGETYTLPPPPPEKRLYGYILRDCTLDTTWCFYGIDCATGPYCQPLTPGGLMFTSKAHFEYLGGFSTHIRIWGAEDVEISLKNFCLGGENVVDPRVFVYHYYKENAKKVKLLIRGQIIFNCLFVASTYFPHQYYMSVRRKLLPLRWFVPSIFDEIDSEQHQQFVSELRSRFVRTFEDWTVRFSSALKGFLDDAARYIEKHPTETFVGDHKEQKSGGYTNFFAWLLSLYSSRKT